MLTYGVRLFQRGGTSSGMLADIGYRFLGYAVQAVLLRRRAAPPSAENRILRRLSPATFAHGFGKDSAPAARGQVQH
jgi:hypothetical protein